MTITGRTASGVFAIAALATMARAEAVQRVTFLLPEGSGSFGQSQGGLRYPQTRHWKWNQLGVRHRSKA